VAPVFSPRKGLIFAKDWTGAAPLFVAAMSDAVAEAMKPLSPRLMIVADRPEAEAMAQAVLGLWKAALRLEA
jgi:uroporphyrinogen-III synthase